MEKIIIKNIIFDFGGVILKHRSTIMEEFVAKMFDLPLNDSQKIWLKYKTRLMTEEMNSREFLQILKSELKSNKTIEELMTMWKELYKKEASGVNYDLLNLVEKLRKNYKVYLFTDTIDIHDEYNRTRGIYEKFDQVFKSFEEKLRKPDPKAYENVLNKIQAKPQECLFIDDLDVNISEAKKLGMKTISYQNNNQFMKDLNTIINYSTK